MKNVRMQIVMYVLFVFVLATIPLSAQTKYGWEKVHPRPGEDTLTDAVLYNVHFVDAQNGFIVGDRGTVLRTTDGESWEKLDVPVLTNRSQSLCAVTSDAAGNVYIGGWSHAEVPTGVLWRSTDLGETWTDLNMAPGFDIVELICTDATTMYAIGDSGRAGTHMREDRRAVILKSTDAGESWRTVAKVDSRVIPNFGVCMRDIQFPSADTGYAVGEKGIALQTTDGGESWHFMDSMDSFYNDFYGLHFFSGREGFFYGESYHMPHTIDGGVSWDELSQLWGYMTDTFFHSPDLGFGCNRGVMRTTDRGHAWTWDTIELVDPDQPYALPAFNAITFTDAQHGWAVGQYGVIYRTSTGGLVHTDRIPAAEKPSLSISPSPLRSRQQATVRVDLPRHDNVRITVYDMLGRGLQSICEGEMSAGSHHISLNTGALRPGTYILVLSGSDGIMSRAFVIL